MPDFIVTEDVTGVNAGMYIDLHAFMELFILDFQGCSHFAEPFLSIFWELTLLKEIILIDFLQYLHS